MRQWTIDAFASAPFRGNPACVLEPQDAWPDAAWMQALAAENNQAETAFLLRTDDPARFGLRWFTPAMEVPLCGHATLASAHVLFAELGADAPRIAFDTLSGPLSVARADDGLYGMDFPAQPPHRIAPPPGLAEALGAAPAEVWASTYLVAVFDDEAQVRALAPDIAALHAVSRDVTLGRGNVGVAALAAGKPYDVVDRFFAPGSGVPEDPTTGSLHCILSPLFADKLGRAQVRFHQAYPGRGGDLECEHRGERVLLRGAAVTVAESALRLSS
jgi:predicted PhzF superfamily epimerase YddE/YHI9